MRIFVTGATGWIGSHTVDELLSHGHEVIGLARSDASAATLAHKGASTLRGDLDDLASLRAGALAADGVVHLANKHDFTNPAASDAAERAAAQTLGEALAGTDKPLLLASGVALPLPEMITEDTPNPSHGPDSMRGGSENLALEFAQQGVRAVIGRFSPTVHGRNDHGFVSYLVDAARRNGASFYAEDGTGRWPAVHVVDTARMIRLGLEKAPAGSILHAVGEQGVPTGDIAAAIATGLGLPAQSISREELTERYGFIGSVFGMDLRASSAKTQELLGWTPTGPTLLDDIAAGAYFPV